MTDSNQDVLIVPGASDALRDVVMDDDSSVDGLDISAWEAVGGGVLGPEVSRLLEEARQARNAGDEASATSCYLSALALMPGDYRLHMAASALLARTARLEEARKHYDLAMSLNPETRDAYDAIRQWKPGDRAWLDKYTRETDPKNLLSANRMDIVIKYLFAKDILLGRRGGRAEKLYRDHIERRTGGRERAAFWNPHAMDSAKESVEEYISSFERLIHSMRDNAFDDDRWIPVSAETGMMLDGAHRVAAALLLKKKIRVFRFPGFKGNKWDVSWFKKNGFSNADVVHLVKTFTRLCGGRVRVVVLWAPAVPHAGEIRKVLGEELTLILSRSLILASETLYDFICDIYAPAVGADADRHGVLRLKADKLAQWPAEALALVYAAGAGTGKDIFRRMKEKARNYMAPVLPADDYVTLHCTDDIIETRHVLDQVTSANQVEKWRRRGPHEPDSAFFAMLDDFGKALKSYNIPIESTAIVGSAVLVAMGLKKECEDIDAIMNTGMRNKRGLDPGIVPLSPTSELVRKEYNARSGVETPLKDNEIVSNPRHYFWYRGYKFANPEIVMMNKKNGKRPKDAIHYELLRQFLQPEDEVNQGKEK